MPRRAGGDTAGCEASEAMRKLCFRYRPHQRAGEDSRLIPPCPSGQVFRHRSASGDDGCLAGRLTVAQAKSPKPGVAGAAESCCAELMEEVESATVVRNERRALSRHRLFNSWRHQPPSSLLWRQSRHRGDVWPCKESGAADLRHPVSAAHRFLPTHSTNAVARSECPPTKRLPLPLALLQRKISAKRGIMKTLEIPNG